MCWLMSRRTPTRATPRRFFSATSISRSWRRRVNRASSACVASSGRGRGVGRTRSANSARIWASIASVLASCPVARAKARIWRGLAMTMGTPAVASVAATACSYPPVASRTTSAGVSARSCPTRVWIPASSFALAHCAPDGRTATSRVAFATSMPTNTGVSFIATSLRAGVPSSWPSLATCGVVPRSTVRAPDERWTTPQLKHGLEDQRQHELSPTVRPDVRSQHTSGSAEPRLQPRMTTERLAGYVNALSDERARAALQRCCGARHWVDAMLAARPFASDAELLATAERVWWGLGRADWLEAFAAHPRIGGRVGAGMGWARREQAGAADGAAATLAALAQGNVTYEERFGHVFLISATGKTADEMLGALRGRLSNDPATELRVAAEEQAKITRLRLDKLAAS